MFGLNSLNIEGGGKQFLGEDAQYVLWVRVCKKY